MTGQHLDWASGSDRSLLCWFTLILNGNTACMPSPRMKKDSCSPTLIWNPLPEIRLHYRRTSDFPARLPPTSAPFVADSAAITIPFTGEITTFANCTSHLDGSFGNKSSDTGVLPPSNTLEYPNLRFLPGAKMDVKCQMNHGSRRWRHRRQGRGKWGENMENLRSRCICKRVKCNITSHPTPTPSK